MSKRWVFWDRGFRWILRTRIGISSYRLAANTASTEKRPRYFGSSLCCIEGCTKGAINAWSLAVSSFGNWRTAFPAREISLGAISQVSARYRIRRWRVVSSIASTQISAPPPPSLLRARGPLPPLADPASSLYQTAWGGGGGR